jgi:hypothetical protein
MDQPRDKRIPIMMSEDETRAIDDWRFANRIDTRSEAIRRLCQLGLQLDRKVSNLDRARTMGFYALQRMRTFLKIPEDTGPIDRDTATNRDADLSAIRSQGRIVSGSLAELGIEEDPIPDNIEECFYDVLTVFREYDGEVSELMGASSEGSREGTVEQVLADLKENSESYSRIREARNNDRPYKGLGGKVIFP